jgi:hypothetical protein
MPFPADELVAQLRQYQAAVREAVGYLRGHDFSTTLLALYRRGPLAQGRAHYEFHGSGCLVRLPDGRQVDFDFGFDERFEESRVDGFSPGFVADYLAQLRGPVNFQELAEGMAALVRAGVLVQPAEHRPQFYFAADWHGPNPVTYSPNARPLDELPDMTGWLRQFGHLLS